MKMLCALAVVAVAVGASTSCSFYCDILYYGWKIAKRTECNCTTSQQKLQNGPKYDQDFKSILQNREAIFKDLHNKKENSRILLTNDNLRGFVKNKPSEVKHNKIKRATHEGIILAEVVYNSPITSKLSEDDLNNTQISEKNILDFNDLLMLIKLRKRNNKNIVKLKKDAFKKRGNLDDLEKNTEVKNKYDRAITIIQQSNEENKNRQKNISKKKKQDVNVNPKMDIRSEVIDETYTNEKIVTTSTVKSTKSYKEIYTNAITTIHNTTVLDSAENDFNISSTLNDNILKKIIDKYYNLKDLNYPVQVIKKNNSTNIKENALISIIVNTTSTKLKNIQTTTGNKTNLSYKLNDLKINKVTDEFPSEKLLNPLTFPEGIVNKSMLMADNSDNVKERTSETNQFITDSNKPLVTKIINLNNTSRRDRYNKNEVPISRIITREYPNNTISSFVNATNILSHFEFEEDT